jgi:hypothetical protein
MREWTAAGHGLFTLTAEDASGRAVPVRPETVSPDLKMTIKMNPLTTTWVRRNLPDGKSSLKVQAHREAFAKHLSELTDSTISPDDVSALAGGL